MGEGLDEVTGEEEAHGILKRSKRGRGKKNMTNELEEEGKDYVGGVEGG